MSDYQIEGVLIEIAVGGKSFYPLLHRSKLMYMWQRTHGNDIAPIALVESHKLKRHSFCKDKCRGIENKLQKQIVQNMLNPLITQMNSIKQLQLL